ncbi:MAG: hypothetical protein OHK0029_31130 [Armatimonadaceae bacterium]
MLYMDERHGLRFPTANPSVGVPVLHVVSLNCAGGSTSAAQEALARFSGSADIILLQEIPPPDQIKALQDASNSGYNFLTGMDTAVLARGNVEAVPLDEHDALYFVVARIQFPEDSSLYAVSLRLIPPLTRIDLFNPECWRAYRKDFRRRREQMERVVQVLKTLPPDTPVLVGGDFNAPAGDGILRPLTSLGLEDSFPRAGQGWGNTIINDVPFHRIDQIWVRPEHLRPLQVRAVKTVYSDHRMVQASFLLPAN